MNSKKELKALGLLFKKKRLSKKLSQSELAAKIDKDQQSIQRFEAGRINPSYIYLLEVCEGLECDLSDILVAD